MIYIELPLIVKMYFSSFELQGIVESRTIQTEGEYTHTRKLFCCTLTAFAHVWGEGDSFFFTQNAFFLFQVGGENRHARVEAHLPGPVQVCMYVAQSASQTFVTRVTRARFIRLCAHTNQVRVYLPGWIVTRALLSQRRDHGCKGLRSSLGPPAWARCVDNYY